jgi:protein-S-isoprenylcysteine O-methyltransferase Ste14
MPLAATALALAWLLVAFVLRTAIQVRRHGDTGIRLHAGPSLSAGWWAKVGLVVSVALVGLAPAMVGAGALPLVGPLDRPAVAVAGGLAAVVGIALTLLAQLAMGASWRIGVDPDERTALVTTGPFAAVRNPIFSTMVLTGGGLTLLAPTVPGIVGTVVLVAAVEVQVRAVEEPYLARVHGAAYAAYVGRAGRFVPRLRRPRLSAHAGGAIR